MHVVNARTVVQWSDYLVREVIPKPSGDSPPEKKFKMVLSRRPIYVPIRLEGEGGNLRWKYLRGGYLRASYEQQEVKVI